MRRAAAVAVLLGIPGMASASLRLADTLVLEYRGNNENGIASDDDYGLGLSKLYLNGQMEQTSVSAQVDSVLFANYPDVANPTPQQPSAYASDARIERISLVHNFAESGTLTLGDSHVQLGRGIALSLRKVDELGTDQALRGGSVAWQADQFSAMAFAGRTNVANLDGVTQRFLEDPDDTLAGGSFTLHLGRADLAFHGLYLKPHTPLLANNDDDNTVLGGTYLELPATDWLTFYAEGAVEQYQLATSKFTGTAAYASADVDLGFVSLLLEGLYLDQFQVAGSRNEVLGQAHAYNQPPTLERLDQEVLDSQNVRGGRMKLSRSFFEGDLVVYVSGMYRQSGPQTAAIDAVHGYGGFELTYGGGASRWNLSGGWRQETQADATDPFKKMAHAETDWVQAIGGGYALHFNVLHESRQLVESGASGANDYVRGSTLFGIDYSGFGSIMAEIGYDTFNPQLQQTFFAGIIAWDAAQWATVRAVLGSQRGGIKCIGGVCRDFPAFSGARLEASVYYDVM